MSARCGNCGFLNPVETKFCGQCGQSMSISCPRCHFTNPGGFKFCGNCGFALTPAPEPQPSQPRAERRQLTVMFCDLVGSTVLSQQLDPEDLRDLVRDYQKVCGAAIRQFEGTVAQYLGDGILVYFGYPKAHEDDARRAVLAGLEILKAIARLSQQWQTRHADPLAVRIGIHTGIVVVGEMGDERKHEQLALGEAPNLAARLQGLAQPGTIAISSATHRLVESYFRFENMGAHRAKGIADPVEVYRVVGECNPSDRKDDIVRATSPSFVGRDSELTQLLDAWQDAKRGISRPVLVMGEAGIGKSRLVQTFENAASREPHEQLACYGSPYFQNSAMYPLCDMLARWIGFDDEDTDVSKLSKLETFAREYDFTEIEDLATIAARLNIDTSNRFSPLTLSPQAQRQKMHAILVRAIRQLARQAPLLWIVEDLHWVDPSTLAFFEEAIAQLATEPILFVGTARPEFHSEWGNSMFQVLTLAHLESEQIEQLLTQIAGNKTLPVEVVTHVVNKTDGVPLFVEELTKMVLESDIVEDAGNRYALKGTLPLLTIPSTLQDSLMARLDRLAPVKELAQLGATIGREFSYDLIRAVARQDEPILQSGLSQLEDAGVLCGHQRAKLGKYAFRNALIRDVAYNSLLKSQRYTYHQRIAIALATEFAETETVRPEMVAYHYTAGGDVEHAIPYWYRAGERAAAASANVEAIAHFDQGLQLLEQLPETPEQMAQAIALYLDKGSALMSLKGYAAAEVEDAFQQAHALCDRLPEAPQRFKAVWGLYGFYAVRAQYDIAWPLARQLEQMAATSGLNEQQLIAHLALGMTHAQLGRATQAGEELERAIAAFPDVRSASPSWPLLCHGALLALGWRAWGLWKQGHVDTALQSIDRAFAVARENAHPMLMTVAFASAAALYRLLRQFDLAATQAANAIAIATEQGFPFWLGWANVTAGQCQVANGAWDEGIAQIERGLSICRETGAEEGRPDALVVLAEACLLAGQVERGLEAIAEAREHAERTHEENFLSELYRVQGELLGKLGETAIASDGLSAVACFERSLEIARQQETPMLALRAVLGWNRCEAARSPESCALLAERLDTFPSDLDILDLREARELLDHMSEKFAFN
ncbi:MAG: adenylate/guanylate cyclase domain-containing protein [Cyanobacteria bacterium J06642_2]